jgi:integrase
MASGSIKKNAKTGLYDIVVDTGKAMSGKRQQKRVRGFRTRGDAQIEVTRILGEVNGNVFMKPDKTLFGSYMTLWLETKRSSMTRLTCDSYESYIKNYIEPVIGNIPLNELTHDHLDTLVADLRGRKTKRSTPFSDSTIQRIFNIIVTALNDAVRTGLVIRNVAKLAVRPKIKRKTVDVWDIDEVQRFLAEVKRSRHYPAYLLALATGIGVA